MKKISYYLSLLFVAIMCLSSCSKDDGDETDNPGGPKDIVISVDIEGQAQAGHYFTRIDDNNFYIDGLKYTYFDGDLYVKGTDPKMFDGIANVISTLKYGDQTINVIGIWNFKSVDKLKTFNIPNTVTTISREAFMDCRNLEKVIIGKGLKYIQSKAFYNCLSLKDVYCYAENVPVAYVEDFVVSPFLRVDLSAATLHVPASSVDKYKADEYWGKFGTILPIEDGTTRIDATSSNCDIKAYGGAITVSGCRDGENVSVYSVGGQLISTAVINNGSAVINTNLQTGSVVIVRIGQKIVKLTLN